MPTHTNGGSKEGFNFCHAMSKRSSNRPDKNLERRNKFRSPSDSLAFLCRVGRGNVARALVLISVGLGVGHFLIGKKKGVPSPSAVAKPATDPKRDELLPIPDMAYQSSATGFEVNFRPIPGVYRALGPAKTCDVDTVAFRNAGPFARYSTIIQRCRGKLQGGGGVFLKTTIPGYHANGGLFSNLDKAFSATGHSRDLPRVDQRTFVFHRGDGKDGLPGGNLSTFTSQGMTTAQPGLPQSFSSIPLDGNKVKDVGALATEICQSWLMALEGAKPEVVCNGYGLAVRSIYSDFSYTQYLQLVDRVAFTISHAPGAAELKFEPVKEEIFNALLSTLGGKPDILERD